MNEGILGAIGRTPLVRLKRLFADSDLRVWAKLESLNPGGSTKDRPALRIIKHGLESGAIKSGTTIIESSSGNMGIGLAQVCSYFGLKFICVVDAKTTAQNIRLLKTYGAEVDLVSQPDPNTGEPQEPDLVAAHQMIDLISLLQEKTKGNLTTDETKLVDDLLYELRMRFVQAQQGQSRIITP